MSKKFVIAVRDKNDTSKTFTVTAPKLNIASDDVTNFTDAYDELYSDSLSVKYAKYIDTSDTYVISPAA